MSSGMGVTRVDMGEGPRVKEGPALEARLFEFLWVEPLGIEPGGKDVVSKRRRHQT